MAGGLTGPDPVAYNELGAILGGGGLESAGRNLVKTGSPAVLLLFLGKLFPDISNAARGILSSLAQSAVDSGKAMNNLGFADIPDYPIGPTVPQAFVDATPVARGRHIINVPVPELGKDITVTIDADGSETLGEILQAAAEVAGQRMKDSPGAFGATPGGLPETGTPEIIASFSKY